MCHRSAVPIMQVAEWSVDMKFMSNKPEKSRLETSGKKLRSEPQMLQCFLLHLLKSGMIPQHPFPTASSEKPALPKLPSRPPSAIHAPVTSSGGAQQRPDRLNDSSLHSGAAGAAPEEPCSWRTVASPAAGLWVFLRPSFPLTSASSPTMCGGQSPSR